MNTEKPKEYLQLDRLKRFVDVVYALVLFQLFLALPRPGEEEWHWDSIQAFMAGNVMTFVLLLVGLAVTILYWTQNQIFLARMTRVDGPFTALMIVQVFFLLLFLYSMRLGIDLGGSPWSRGFESVVVAIMGFAGSRAWSYASKEGNLISADVSPEDVEDIHIRYLAEPITALFTLLFLFMPILWEVSWFVGYPLALRLVRSKMGKKE